MWSPAPPLITVNNTGKDEWTNHSTYLTGGYKDSNCIPCHALNGTYAETSLNYSHSIDVGLNGGKNCTNCHYNGSGYHNIDIDAANISVHSGMNAQNATSAGVDALNGACWACHDADGNITNNPDSLVMGDIYNKPRICVDCHLANGTYYPQSVSWGGLTVSEHYSEGIGIRAGNSTSNISSCINCHENVSEMTLPNNDTDYGSFPGDGVRLTGGNRSFYHYGRSRIDLRTMDSGRASNCSYCHQNSSTAFTASMTDQVYNINISNHSNYSSNPDCTSSQCHNTGWMHNSTLAKPTVNSTYCLSCHGGNGTGGTNYTGAVTGIKEKHNNSLNCTECHTNTVKDVHPVKYLSQDATYSTLNTSAVNCISCHQTKLAGFITAPIIPDFKHSNTSSSGRKWGNYWDNTSLITACYFCHQKDVHSASILGNVSLIKGSNILNNQNLTNSTWCAACHYNNNSTDYKGNLIDPEPPEILNRSGKVPNNASDGTAFYNHSEIQNYKDSHCKTCHGSLLTGYLETSLNFSHRVGEGGGGKDCISCHNKSSTGSPLNLRVDGSAIEKGVHKNLNIKAYNSSATDPINKACWACHGDGTEPSGHPARYKLPRKCDSSDCHSLSQSVYNEKMVYSHFRNASSNSNPGNATNYNVTTSAGCQVCHMNSVVTKDNNPMLAIVSHYGSKDKLVDSFNCRYCHIDKDNSIDWGEATLINRNRTALIEFEKERNKLSVSEGGKIYLGEGYYLKLVEITATRDEALIQLFNGDRMVDETSLQQGRLYEYEAELTIDNSTIRTPVIKLNITSIFKGNKGFIQFEGFRIRKVHSERESRNNTNCFACHLYRYPGEKKRFIVIDREDKENSRDLIYYTSVFIDFISDNKSKIYSADEDNVITQLLKNEESISYPSLQKLLKEGETWNIADNYALRLNEVSTESKLAWMTLTINGVASEDAVITLGNWFNYTPGLAYKDGSKTNITVFTAKVSAISQGKPDFVILSDVSAISPAIMKITENSTLFGYNSSWLKPGDTITTGKIPVNLHAPDLFTDQRNWADCVKCHDSSWKLGIAGMAAISTQLGKHSGLNRNASGKTILSDNIDRACWACHTGGEEPLTHPPARIKARICSSCHTYQEKPFYDAKYVGDEPHGLEQNCENCHYRGSHNVVRFQVTPGIKEASLSPEKPGKGEKVILVASAHSGYRMTIKAAEYFIDTIGRSGNGMPLEPVDGLFDSQKEDAIAEINTTGIDVGDHVIFIHAMERDNRWGAYYPVNFTIVEMSYTSGILNNLKNSIYSEWSGIIYLIIVIIVAYFAISWRSRNL